MLKRILIFWAAWVAIVFTAVLLAVQDEAKSDLIEVSSIYVDYKSFFSDGVDPLLTQTVPNRTLGKELNLVIETDVLQYFYWNSTIHSDTDKVVNSDGSTSGGQFREVGLEMSFGFDFRRLWIGVPITAGYYHYSRHILDYEESYPFPREDAIQIKLYLYGKGNDR